MDSQQLRICVVGPMPPPFGGMANQCEQLVRLLRAEGLHVDLVRTNTPYQPEWVAQVRYVRALFRLVPFLIRLWKAAGKAQLMHVLANSGWAWHLCASPAIFVARLRGTPVIVNYRGGYAETFFGTAPRHVLKTLAKAELRVAPSATLPTSSLPEIWSRSTTFRPRSQRSLVFGTRFQAQS